MPRLPAPPAELVSFLEGLPDPHILLDDRYRILAANGAYRRQFGAAGATDCGGGCLCRPDGADRRGGRRR
mgnify:CR=1 FL=1